MLQFLKSRPEGRNSGRKTHKCGEVALARGGRFTPNTGGGDCYARFVAEPSEGKLDDAGVLGNLPNRRPRVESPRRAKARAAASPPPPAESADAAAVVEAEAGPSGLEELARAGAGLTIGAAAAGLKLAGRAAGGLGRVVGRG